MKNKFVQIPRHDDYRKAFIVFPEKMVWSHHCKKERRTSRLKAKPGADDQCRGYDAELMIG